MKRTLKLFLLHSCRLLGLFALSRLSVKGKLLILCYHGFQLSDEAQFRPRLFMTPERFRARMMLLSSRGLTVLPISEALDKLREDSLGSNSVVITIDDGFYSTYEACYPVLRSYDFPATLYVTSYYVTKEVPIFRLAVQYMFWKTRVRTTSFDTDWGGNLPTVDLNDAVACEKAMNMCISYGEEHCSEDQRQVLLSELGVLLEVDAEEIRHSRILSLVNFAEMKELLENKIDIQLHTHRHHFPTEDEEVARKEIHDNRMALDKVTEDQLVHFCYPSGVWSSEQWPWLESMKVESATTCEAGLNDCDAHKYALKRFLDSEEISDIEFLSEITGFSELVRRAKRKIIGETFARLG